MNSFELLLPALENRKQGERKFTRRICMMIITHSTKAHEEIIITIPVCSDVGNVEFPAFNEFISILVWFFVHLVGENFV